MNGDIVYALARGPHLLATYRRFRGVDRESGVPVNGMEACYDLRYPSGHVRALSRYAHVLSPEQAKADFDRAILANGPVAE